MVRPSTVERAYQLARSGECADIEDVRKRLRAEGFENLRSHLQGRSVSKAIRELCVAAYTGPPKPARNRKSSASS